MNVEWIQEQFNTDLAEQERKIKNGINITTSEIIHAMNKIGKNKAPSYDGMLDIIF